MLTLKEIYQEATAGFYDFVTAPDKKYHHREVPGEYGPVIAIPGFGGKWEGKDWHNFMASENIHAIFANFGSLRGPVEEYVDELNKLIEEKKLKNVNLIGYSMGGLIAVRFAQKYGWENVNKIITLATPFSGVRLASFAPFVSALKDMSPGSNFLKNLRQEEIRNNKVVCICGNWDEFAGSEEAALPNSQKIKIPISGHLNISRQIGLLGPIFKKYINENLRN